MRINQYIILIVVVLLHLQANCQSVFERANDFYQKGDYQQAIVHYNSILKDKKHSPEIYFNLANSYYKSNKIAEAIYHYEKALLLNPNNKDVLNNLKIAKQKTIDDIPEYEAVGWEKFISSFTSKYHFDTWGYFAVFWSFLGVVFFFLYYLNSNKFIKKWAVGLMIFSFLNVFICTTIGFYEKNRIQSNLFAIVMGSEVSIKNEPIPSSNQAFLLHEGAKIQVLESIDQWHKIAVSDDMIGWVSAPQIRIIK